MKKVSTLCMVIATTLFFGCEGPEGPLGPQGSTGGKGEIGALGPKGDKGDVGTNGTAGANGTAGTNGTNGTAGTNGTNGKDGNANVVYSAWMSPTWASSGSGTNTTYFTQKDTKNSMLTQDAIDKGVIYTYVKIKALEYDSEAQEYGLVERITPNYGYSYVKIPGRNTNGFYDYARSAIFVNDQIGVNYLSVTGDMYKLAYDATTASQLPIPELANKSFAFYNDLTKDLYKYRIVVVNGSTQGRTANVNMKDYAAVKRAFNLPD